MRQSFDSVILEPELKNSLKRLNPKLPESALQEAYNNILHL
jgi:type I restriction enzyme R subunit